MELQDMRDQELLDSLKALVHQERGNSADVVEHLAEVDRRRLYADRGYPSLFAYCVAELGYAEPSAYHRIRAARAIQKQPCVLDMLRSGELSLETVVLLHPHLEADGVVTLLEQAKGRSKREVEALVAPLSPVAEPRETVRIISIRANREPADGAAMPLFEAAERGAAAPAPLSIETCVHVSFTAGRSFMELLQRAREVLRHKHPGGRLEDIFEDALAALLARRDPDLWDAPKGHALSATRKIPRWVQDEVWRRDQACCTFLSADGRRCGSRDDLEFDHITPWALGGSSNDPANIRLLCRTHNQLEAARIFGKREAERFPQGSGG